MLRNRRKVVAQFLKYTVICGLALFLLKITINLIGVERKLTPTIDELGKLIGEAEVENVKRLLRIKNTCQKYNLGIYKKSDELSVFKHPPAPQYSVFYIASISEEELNSGKEQISSIARRAIPELEYPEADEALKATKKLLVVRHPFERLLSAYRDKLENSVAGREHGTLHFYRKYGSKIVQKYRATDFTKPLEDQVIRRKDVPPPAGIEPTFREFVEYLIHTDLPSYGDDHWMPYYAFCTPCIVDYDIIAKVESLWRDQIYTIHKLNIQELIKPRWRHSSGYSNASKIYFSQLNRDTVRRLFEKFRLDFELFDYSPDIYFQYATAS